MDEGESEVLKRLWFKRILRPTMWVAFGGLNLWLAFFQRGGFSNTDDQVGLAMERMIFGTMFAGPPLALLVWGLCGLGYWLHRRAVSDV